MYPLEYKKIGRRLKEYRKAKGISQEKMLQEMALRGVHMSRNKLSGMENGIEKWFKSASLFQLGEICDILGCSIGHLLGEYDCKDYEAQVIQNETALSEGAISALRGLVSSECNDTRRFTYLLSLLLESGNLEYSLTLLGSYVSFVYKEIVATKHEDEAISLGFVRVEEKTAYESLISIHALNEARSAAERYEETFVPIDLINLSLEKHLLDLIEKERDIERRSKLIEQVDETRKGWNDPDVRNPFLDNQND